MLSVGVFLALHASTSAGSTWHTRQAVLYRYESSCVHAPVSQAVVGSFDVMTNANNAAGRLFSINSNSNSNDDDVSRMILPEEVVSTPRPEHCLADADLPNMWDWRNVTIARGAPVSCNALDVNSSTTLYIYINDRISAAISTIHEEARHQQCRPMRAHYCFIPSVSLFLLPNAKAIDFTTRIRNQFLPFWCGSCWVSVCCYSTRNHRCIPCTPLVFQNLLKMILCS